MFTLKSNAITNRPVISYLRWIFRLLFVITCQNSISFFSGSHSSPSLTKKNYWKSYMFGLRIFSLIVSYSLTFETDMGKKKKKKTKNLNVSQLCSNTTWWVSSYNLYYKFIDTNIRYNDVSFLSGKKRMRFTDTFQVHSWLFT